MDGTKEASEVEALGKSEDLLRKEGGWNQKKKRERVKKGGRMKQRMRKHNPQHATRKLRLKVWSTSAQATPVLVRITVAIRCSSPAILGPVISFWLFVCGLQIGPSDNYRTA